MQRKDIIMKCIVLFLQMGFLAALDEEPHPASADVMIQKRFDKGEMVIDAGDDGSLEPPEVKFMLAKGGMSCTEACGEKGQTCDEHGLRVAAGSVRTCKNMLNRLGYHPKLAGQWGDDNSGCTYHPGRSGWAQLMRKDGDPKCDVVNSDGSRRRLCACDGNKPKKPPTCNEDLQGNGVGYRGCQTKTKSGERCKTWPSFWKKDYPTSGLESNYCRNPDRDRTIWCYTSGSWDYCDPLPATQPGPAPAPMPAPAPAPMPATTTTTMTPVEPIGYGEFSLDSVSESDLP